MGLDMYLMRRKFLWGNKESVNPEYRSELTLKIGGVEKDTSKIVYVVEQVGYWRKFNALHKWFVENVQKGIDECQESYVPNEKIEELFQLLEKLESNKDNAEKILPTVSGFFFGSTEYDEWYWEKVKETKETLKKILEENDGDLYYQASW